MNSVRLIKFWRTFREGFRNFHRDLWLSFATVSILTLSLYIMTVTFFLVTVGGILLYNVQSKVNISMYLYPTVSKERINDIKDGLQNIREVESVIYVSQEQALDELKKSNIKDPFIDQALKEIGENPLFPSLVVKARNPDKYSSLAKLLSSVKYENDVYEVNYSRNQDVIERLSNIISIAKRIGLFLGSIFVLIAILVVYNTIRITMFSRRQEFEIMRLVGASNLYVRLPSVFEGIFYGIVSSVVTMILLTITMYFLTPIAQDIIFGNTIFGFYGEFFWRIFGSTIFLAVLLGVISSSFAIRRYLDA